MSLLQYISKSRLASVLHVTCRNCSQLQRKSVIKGSPGKANGGWFRKGESPDKTKNISAAHKDLWKVPKGVHMKLRREILMKPKFSDQVNMTGISLKNMLNRQQEIDKCKVDLANLQSIENVHSLMANIVRLFSNYDKVRAMRVLQKECCAKLHKWNMPQILHAMDLFYCAEYMAPRYHGAAFKLIDLKLHSMDVQPKDIVQLLFYTTIRRTIPITLIRQLEDIIVMDLKAYTPEELSLICNGFFVTNNRIHDYMLLEHIATTLIHAVAHIFSTGNSVLIGNYIKVLRHAHYMQDKKFLNEIGDIFAKQISVSNNYAILQLYRTYTSIHYHHEKFLQKYFAFLNKKNIKESRLRFKDLVDIIWGCAVFRITPPGDVCAVLQSEIKQNHDQLIMEFPDYHIRSLVSLALVKVYPYNAISEALSLKHLQNRDQGTMEQTFQYLLLDQTMEILCPDYGGDRLPESWYMRRDQDVRTQLEWRKGFAALLSALRTILPSPHCVRIDMVMKFAPLPDLIIHVDKDNKPIPQRDNGAEYDVSTLLQGEDEAGHLIDTDHIMWYTSTRGDNTSIMEQLMVDTDGNNPKCLHLKPQNNDLNRSGTKVRKLLVKVLGWQQYLVNRDSIHGMHLHALDLLLALGYELIVISPPQAGDLESRTSVELQDFVRTEILDKFCIKY